MVRLRGSASSGGLPVPEPVPRRCGLINGSGAPLKFETYKFENRVRKRAAEPKSATEPPQADRNEVRETGQIPCPRPPTRRRSIASGRCTGAVCPLFCKLLKTIRIETPNPRLRDSCLHAIAVFTGQLSSRDRRLHMHSPRPGQMVNSGASPTSVGRDQGTGGSGRPRTPECIFPRVCALRESGAARPLRSVTMNKTPERVLPAEFAPGPTCPDPFQND
jgi:hypothetical protein